MLSDRIEALGTTGATHRKAVAFFVNAAKAAQLPVPAGIAKQARNRPSSTARKQPPKPPAGDGQMLKDPSLDAGPPGLGSSVPKALHPALVPFLNDLVKIGRTWDDTTYHRWKETWDKVLVYAYPVADAGQVGEGAG